MAMKLPATLTMATTAAAWRELSQAIGTRGAGSAFALDASPVQELDSSALALLLDARRQAEARGLAFSIEAAPARLRQLAALYGVAELLGLPPA
jgi:phospholipid transport system transporter-binding protein